MDKDFEITGLKITTNHNLDILVFCIYRSPNGNLQNFFHEFDEYLNLVAKKKKSFIILGYFFINGLKTQENGAKQFRDLVTNVRLVRKINKPT